MLYGIRRRQFANGIYRGHFKRPLVAFLTMRSTASVAETGEPFGGSLLIVRRDISDRAGLTEFWCYQWWFLHLRLQVEEVAGEWVICDEPTLFTAA